MNYLPDRYIAGTLASAALVVMAMYLLRPDVSRRAVEDAAQPFEGPYTVVRVVDGDTLILEGNRKVRLIGVDTPELHHPDLPVQRFAEEAREFARRLAGSRRAMLEFKADERADSYGRLLAYVHVDGVLLNAEIIKRGYGHAYTRYPHPRLDEFTALERKARKAQAGMWNYSLSDGRVAGIAARYDLLGSRGKERFDAMMDELLKKYPAAEWRASGGEK